VISRAPWKNDEEKHRLPSRQSTGAICPSPRHPPLDDTFASACERLPHTCRRCTVAVPFMDPVRQRRFTLLTSLALCVIAVDVALPYARGTTRPSSGGYLVAVLRPYRRLLNSVGFLKIGKTGPVSLDNQSFFKKMKLYTVLISFLNIYRL
jgi:hypothetical protein